MGYLKAIIKRYYWFCYGFLSLSFGFLKQKNQFLIGAIVNQFKAGKKVKPLLPEIKFENILSDTAKVKLFEADFENGNISALELIRLTQLVQDCKPQKIFEFGTFNGRSTLNLIANSNSKAKIWTLDLPESEMNSSQHAIDSHEKQFVKEEKKQKRKYEGTVYKTRVVQLFGDSGKFNFSEFEGKMDFVFIDASHTYENVIHDTKTALKLLRKKKGMIIWHDYNGWPGVTQALNEQFQKKKGMRKLKHIQGTSLAMLDLRGS